jgi:putative FmdB family regulatory protein
VPLYDYDCAACGRRVEVIHGVHAPGPTHCPNCGGGPLRKAISAPAVHFKGTGWAKKERRAAAPVGSSKSSNDTGDTAAKSSTSDKSEGSPGGSPEGSTDSAPEGREPSSAKPTADPAPAAKD